MTAASAPSRAPAKAESALTVINTGLESRIPRIAEVLPQGENATRFVRTAIVAISKNPDLLACDPESIFRAIYEAAEIGVTPTGSLSRAWLVPFRPEKGARPQAQLIVGYQGLADLMRRTGQVRRVWTDVVYEGDDFAVVRGSAPRLDHVPAFATEDPSKITHVYAVAEFNDGGIQFEVMTRAQVELIRSRSRGKNSPAWVQSWAQMARKTALRRLANYVPLTATAITAIERDDEREYGPAPTGERRSNAVLGMIRRNRGLPAEEVEGEATEVDDTAQDAASGENSAQGAPEASSAVCGSTSDPRLGPEESCIEPPGHAPKTPHKSAEGSVWRDR